LKDNKDEISTIRFDVEAIMNARLDTGIRLKKLETKEVETKV
jgi:hypothetical protein